MDFLLLPIQLCKRKKVTLFIVSDFTERDWRVSVIIITITVSMIGFFLQITLSIGPFDVFHAEAIVHMTRKAFES